MRQYELMLVVKPDFDHESTKKREDLIKKLFIGQDAKITDITDMGKKTLAYPIRKFTEGVYFLLKIEANALNVGAIEQQVKLDETVLRYLLTVTDEGKK